MKEPKSNLPKRNKETLVATDFICDVKPGAKEVFLAGDFNAWNPRSEPMAKRKEVFAKTLLLPAGEHQYKFVVDGEWVPDPRAASVANDQGTVNSVRQVT